MFCGNCGTENVDGAKYCKNCGKPLPEVKKEAPKTNINVSQEVGKLKNIPPKYLFSGMGIIVALIVTICITNVSSKTINLDKYVTIETEGYDGYGRASAEIDWVAIEEEYGEKIKLSKNAKDEYGGFASLVTPVEVISGCVNLEIDERTGLSNGDVINYTWKVSDELSEYIDGKVKYKDGSVTVKDLEKVGTFDAFYDLAVNFYGIAPDGSVDFEYTGSELNYYAFTSDRSRGLSNGDIVKISIDESYIEQCAEAYGKVPSEQEKEYTVTGLESYVTKLGEIDDASLETLKKQAEDVYNADVAKNWGDSESLRSFTYLGDYLLTSKSSDTWGYQNYLYLVYKAEVENYYSNKGKTYDDTNEIYWYIRFDNLMIGSDGTLNVNPTNYRTVGNRIKIDSGISGGWFSTVSWSYYGYNNLDDLYREVVSSNMDVYNHEENIDEAAVEKSAPEKSETKEYSDDELIHAMFESVGSDYDWADHLSMTIDSRNDKEAVIWVFNNGEDRAETIDYFTVDLNTGDAVGMFGDTYKLVLE